MKKILIFTIFCFLFIGIVSAEYAVFDGEKLTFGDSELATSVSNVVCVSDLNNCTDGMITEKVKEEEIEKIAKFSPEAETIINKYNQIQEMIEKGAEIKESLTISDGELTSGAIEFKGEEEIDVSSLIGIDLEKGEILAKNVRFEKVHMGTEDIKTKITFTQDSGIVEVDGQRFDKVTFEQRRNPSYLLLNEKGEIIYASISTNDEESVYDFHGVKFNIPPSSSFNLEAGEFIDGQGAIFYFENGADIMNIDKSLSLSQSFSGKNINFPNGLFIKEGKVRINEKGYLIGRKNGRYGITSDIGYNQLRIESKGKNLLIANSGADMSDYSGNWIRQTDDNLEIKSCKFTPEEDCKIVAEVLEGNKIFDTDDNDKLTLTVRYGAGLVVDKGVGENPPKIEYSPTSIKLEEFEEFQSFGKDDLKIINDGIHLSMGEEGILTRNTEPLHEDFKEGRIQSVPFEFESDGESWGDMKITVDEFSKLSLISKGEDRVVYEKQGYSPLLLSMNKEDLNTFLVSLRDKFSEKYGFKWGSEEGGIFHAVPLAAASLQVGLSPEQTIEFIENFEGLDETNSVSNHVFLSDNLPKIIKREFDGSNLKDLGIGLTNVMKYSKTNLLFQTRFLEEINLKYSKIKNKKDLSEELSKAFNSYIDEEDYPNEYHSTRFAVLMNKVHDNENSLDKTDFIREGIVSGLSDESKYLLIAQANSDLYQSSFDKIYNSLPENSVEMVRELDPSGEFMLGFVLGVGERDRLNGLLEQDSEFLKAAIYEGLRNTRSLEQNTVSLANVLIEIYENPAYKWEKEFIERDLVNLYGNGGFTEKTPYAYLIKLNEKSSNSEFREIYDSLPELPEISVPECNRNVCVGKQYFYSDENWFETTKREYARNNGPYQMKIVQETEDTAVLEKKLENGRIMRMILTTDNSDSNDVLKDDVTILITHRGHSYNSQRTFEGESDKRKIIIDGGCGGPARVLEIQKKYPNAQVVYDKNTAEGNVNQYEAYKILRRVAMGQSDWDQIRDLTEEKNGIVLPNDKNQMYLRYAALFDKPIQVASR